MQTQRTVNDVNSYPKYIDQFVEQPIWLCNRNCFAVGKLHKSKAAALECIKRYATSRSDSDISSPVLSTHIVHLTYWSCGDNQCSHHRTREAAQKCLDNRTSLATSKVTKPYYAFAENRRKISLFQAYLSGNTLTSLSKKYFLSKYRITQLLVQTMFESDKYPNVPGEVKNLPVGATMTLDSVLQHKTFWVKRINALAFQWGIVII